MSLLIYAIYVFVAMILITAFINIKLSVSLYVSYLILVPYLNIPIGSFSVGYNFVNAVILLGFLYHQKTRKKRTLNFKFTLPFLFLFISQLFLGFFGDLPFSIQLNMWRVNFMSIIFLSFVIWNLGIADKDFNKYMIISLIISFSIAGIYALFLTRLEGINPYTTFLSLYFGKEDFAERFATNPDRLVTTISNAPRIQSTAGHAMNWTVYTCLFIVFLFVLYIKSDKKKSRLYLLLMILLYLLILFLAGVRTGIAALVIAFVYFMLVNRKFKYIAIGGIIFITGINLILSNAELTNYFSTFFDITETKSNITGSSISMRLDQLQGAFVEIHRNPLTGHGYNWTVNYIGENLKTHPVLLAFESLVFTVLCNSGYLGMVVWIVFFTLLVRLNRQVLSSRADRMLINTLIVLYVAYSIGTGEYNYQQYFSIFYSFLLSYLYQLQWKAKRLA
jgi:hypothetical protein